jgi:hypothetical protein
MPDGLHGGFEVLDLVVDGHLGSIEAECRDDKR